MRESYLSRFSEKRFLKKLVPLAAYTDLVTSRESGRGVVSINTIPAGTLLGIYPGAYISYKTFLEKEQFVSRSVKSAYMHSKDTIIDPTDMFGYLPDTPELRIALINEATGGEQTNIVAVSTRKYVWYLTLKEISAGEELFTNYGAQYQRNYPSSNSEEQKFSSDQVKCLIEVSRRYRWIRSGIKELLGDAIV